MDEDIIRTLWWRLLIESDTGHDDMLDLLDAYLSAEAWQRLRALVEDKPDA